MRVHGLVQHIQSSIETNLRVWKYLLPPSEEKDGHEIMGSIPIWQPIQSTDHFICQSGFYTHQLFWFLAVGIY